MKFRREKIFEEKRKTNLNNLPYGEEEKSNGADKSIEKETDGKIEEAEDGVENETNSVTLSCDSHSSQNEETIN